MCYVCVLRRSHHITNWRVWLFLCGCWCCLLASEVCVGVHLVLFVCYGPSLLESACFDELCARMYCQYTIHPPWPQSQLGHFFVDANAFLHRWSLEINVCAK